MSLAPEKLKLVSNNKSPRPWRRVLVPLVKIKFSKALLSSRLFREARNERLI
jgi:hypothetical protein